MIRVTSATVQDGEKSRPASEKELRGFSQRIRFLAEPDRLKCHECGAVCYDQYMVEDRVWLEVVPARKGVLHLVCLEKLLGRSLDLRDFPVDKPINDVIYWAWGR